MRKILIGVTVLLLLAACDGLFKKPLQPRTQVEPDLPQAPDPELPLNPIVQKCDQNNFKITLPIQGFMESNNTYAWLALSRSGMTLATGAAQQLDSGDYTGVRLELEFVRDDVPEGMCELFVLLSDDSSTVGQVDKRIFSAGPYHLNLTYASIITAYCLDTQLVVGDSVWFCADSVYVPLLQQYYWDIHAHPYNYFEDKGSFTIRNVWSNDSARFVKLDDNLFFPLNVGRVNSVKWQLTFIRNRNGNGKNDTTIVDLVIVLPDRLGTTNNIWDYEIIQWSERWSLPPQIVKAIVDQESDFGTYSFRYEMGFDYNNTQETWQNKAAYRAYTIADLARRGTPPGYDRNGNVVPQGDSIESLSLDPYMILRDNSEFPPVIIADIDGDSLIEASELDELNQRYSHTGNNFVSQIVLSSSYGLMQSIHVTLIDYVGFGMRNPQVLMSQPTEGIAWGAKNLKQTFDNYVDNSYTWSEKWQTAIGKYNGGRGALESFGNFTNYDINQYVYSVLYQVTLYQPMKGNE